MTSGLFNTGGAGGSDEFTSLSSTAQTFGAPCNMSDVAHDKFQGHDDFLSTLGEGDADLDMDLFGDLGSGLDQLADDSLDSFTDLTALLSEHNAFFNQLKEEGPASFPDLSTTDQASSTTTMTLKRSFQEMEAGSSDVHHSPACVSLPSASALDHDYTAKRPRISVETEESTVEEVFLIPNPLPAPTPAPAMSTSFTIPLFPEDKSRTRREKNNVASKRSRQIRKQKFVDMESEAEQLVIDNARLEVRVAQLEALAKKMKEILVAKMAGK